MEELLYITPKQPFFVTASRSYLKYVLNKFGIVHFYQCVTGEEPVCFIPDGSADMLFCCDPAAPCAELCGTVLSMNYTVMKPCTLYFGVRFLPGFNPVIGQVGIMQELVNNKIDLSELIHDERMMEGIFTSRDFKEQINCFMRSYLSIYRRVCPQEYGNLLVRHSAITLFRMYGNVSVEEMASDTGYSVRYINQCFKDEMGLSPKQLARIIRFQTAVSALNDPRERSLTEIAADLGYFDQAHFVHDFKSYTGLTPKKYQSFLKEEEFRARLNVIK